MTTHHETAVMNVTSRLSRRCFLAGATAGAAVALAAPNLHATTKKAKPEYAAFIKFIQKLSYRQLAETVAELGFQGIEGTIRDGGIITPQNVVDELPKLMEELKKCNLKMTVMASSINRADDPLTQRQLKVAAELGVPRYRMKYYRYNLKKPIAAQLEQLRPVIADLVALNRELGIAAVYQNHSGAQYVGATLWDLYTLFKQYKPSEIGVAFDIRHATVEGGLAWPFHFQLVQPVLGAVYVKDFRWEKEKQPRNVPLGKGRVDKAFFDTLRQQNYSGPISLHVEYLHGGSTDENVKALRDDLATLKKYLN